MRLCCEIALEMDSPEVIEALMNRESVLKKVVFQEMGAVLQKMYSRYVQEGRVCRYSPINGTHRPSPYPDIIHKGYEYYLAEGKLSVLPV